MAVLGRAFQWAPQEKQEEAGPWREPGWELVQEQHNPSFCRGNRGLEWGRGLIGGVVPKGRNISYEGDGFECLNVWLAPAVTLRSNSGVPDGAGAEHRPGNLIPLLLAAPWPWGICFKEAEGSSPSLQEVQRVIGLNSASEWVWFFFFFIVSKCQGLLGAGQACWFSRLNLTVSFKNLIIFPSFFMANCKVIVNSENM